MVCDSSELDIPYCCIAYIKFLILGREQCTMNVHLLRHLPMNVKLYGPLWSRSAFCFEDGMGHLVRKAHGTHDIGHQVYNTRVCQYMLLNFSKIMSLYVVLTD